MADDRQFEYEIELFQTDLKWTALLWRGDRLARLSFYKKNRSVTRDDMVSSCGCQPRQRRSLTDLAERVIAYSRGVRVSFADVKIEPAATVFRSNVMAYCQTIPFGEVVTYGEVAKAVGSPASARAVGGVMQSNPVPLVVPCHRVVGAGNRLVGFSAGSGIPLKRQLLEMEGNKREFVL